MTILRFSDNRPRRALAAGAAGLVVAGAVAYGASAAAAPGSPSCAAAHKTYAKAKSAQNQNGVTVVKAHPATFHCGGPDDGSYHAKKAKEVLTLQSNAVVKVFKNPEDPSTLMRVPPSKLPHWLKHNASEPFYRIWGTPADVTKMVEKFHP